MWHNVRKFKPEKIVEVKSILEYGLKKKRIDLVLQVRTDDWIRSIPSDSMDCIVQDWRNALGIPRIG